MENAAISIYNAVIERLPYLKFGDTIGFVCGKGNNGGDGFAVARHFLINGFKVKVIHISEEDEMSRDTGINFVLLRSLAPHNKNKLFLKKYSSTKDINYLNNCSIIFDALLGSGTDGELKSPYKEIVNKLNELKAVKVAIDIPTGLNADTGFGNLVFKADLSITLGEFKKGLFFGDGYAFSGEVIKGSIGIPKNLFDVFRVNEFLIEPEDALLALPIKEKKLNKYSAGKVLCICGSENYPGAALLSSLSAIKIGAGASILCFPKSVRKLVHAKHSELVIYNFEDDRNGYLTEKSIEELSSKIKWADCIALGSGLGRSEETQNAVLSVLKKFPEKKFVLDADAIFALSNNIYKKVNLKNKVLTPHYGEFANVIGMNTKELEKDLLLYGKKFSSDTGCHLVLKGPRTLIFNPECEVFINTSGNVGLAKFGSGDVLTGILAGMIAQKKEIENSIIAGVYLHGLSADLLLQKHTEYCYTASQLLDNIPESIKILRKLIV
jgi:NAD(P)H-hydrate epimerase